MIFVRYINSFAKVMTIANKSDIGLTNYAMYNLHFYTCIVQKTELFLHQMDKRVNKCC